jgi:hypothetical protein
VKAEVDEGHRGLANEFPDQVSAPPRKPTNLGEGAITEQYGWRQATRMLADSRPPSSVSGRRSYRWPAGCGDDTGHVAALADLGFAAASRGPGDVSLTWVRLSWSDGQAAEGMTLWA